jgi:hypothetical protein
MTAPRPPVPEWLRGLWRRRSIRFPDGRVDDTTQVYWLQTESMFADIRIPAQRPELGQHASLQTLNVVESQALAQQGGFAGWTELDGSLCRWRRVIDYQPDSGVADEGRLRRDAGLLIEEGIHTPYTEVWERLTPDAADCGAWQWMDALGRQQMLVRCADVCISARARAVALPRAESLTALLDAAAPAAHAALLDCELSLARRSAATGWQIELSTLPFRQGEELVLPPSVAG